MNSPLLQGGGRRRRPGAWLALLAVALAPLAVGAAVYLALDEGEARGAHVAQVAATRESARALAPRPQRPRRRVPQVRLGGVDAFHLRLSKEPRAALVFDVRTGEVLWRLRPRRRVPIASLTKIMTAILVTERAGPEERVKITRAALRYQGSGVGVLPKGRRVRLETLLNGLMIVSGNDAAIALAGHVAGDERRFVGVMNRRARQLGLRCTRFVDSHGLNSRNRSCARDLAVLTRVAMRSPRIRRVVGRRQVQFKFPVKGGRLFLAAHNPLFRVNYRGATGLKTGYTNAAGRCFVGVARRGRRTLGVVLLGSPNPTAHAPALLDAGFKRRRRG